MGPILPNGTELGSVSLSVVRQRPQGGLCQQARDPDPPQRRPTQYVGRRSEDTYAAAPRHTVGILTEALKYVGAEVVATVLAPGVHRRDEVHERMVRLPGRCFDFSWNWCMILTLQGHTL